MNTNNNKPNNFSVVPAAVLLNDTITDKAKILYSEISACATKKVVAGQLMIILKNYTNVQRLLLLGQLTL